MGKGGGGIEAGYGELFFSRTYDFPGACLVRQAGRSEHTRKSYKLGLGALYDYVTGQLAIPPGRLAFRLCTYELLPGRSRRTRAAGLANGTASPGLAAVRAYLRYAADGDPSLISVWLATRKVPTLPTPKRQRPVIEAGDLAAFLDAPERTRIGNRDRLVLVLPLDTAMRAAGPVGAAPGDLVLPDGAPASALARGKGRRERRIGLSGRADARPRAYLEACHGGNRDPSTPLAHAVTHGAARPTPGRNVERIASKYGDVARREHPGIPKTHPHMVRRTRATTPCRDGVPTGQVSTPLGHQQTGTTRSHYAYPSPEQLREAAGRGGRLEPNAEREWVGHEEEIKRKFGL